VKEASEDNGGLGCFSKEKLGSKKLLQEASSWAARSFFKKFLKKFLLASHMTASDSTTARSP
jgi:hypothetical protein